MLLDEQELLSIASNTDLASAVAEAETRQAAANEAEAALDGLRVELDVAITKHQTLTAKRARRATEGRREKVDHAQKFFNASSNTSTAEAVASYARIAQEDAFLADVLALSQQAIDAARVAVAAGELKVAQADAQYQAANVITLACKHLAAAAALQETDPGLEIKFGPAIVEALDRLAETEVNISKKERGA